MCWEKGQFGAIWFSSNFEVSYNSDSESLVVPSQIGWGFWVLAS